MSYSLGVDLGGTNIKIVVIDNDGNVLEYLTSDTSDAEGSWAQTIKHQLELIQNQRGASPCHIGLAAPGLAAKDGRSIAYMQGRLQGLQGLSGRIF
jgi:glucokinase